jgi:hypothetical protein
MTQSATVTQSATAGISTGTNDLFPLSAVDELPFSPVTGRPKQPAEVSQDAGGTAGEQLLALTCCIRPVVLTMRLIASL